MSKIGATPNKQKRPIRMNIGAAPSLRMNKNAHYFFHLYEADITVSNVQKTRALHASRRGIVRVSQ